jgi:exosome complex component RRP41
MVIRESLEPAIFSIMFPRTAVDIYIEIVQADGGTRCASITAASLALADAGVPLKDLVAGCAAGKIEGKLVLDLNDTEDKYGDADLPLAYIPRTEEITLLQMDGSFSPQEFEDAVNLAIIGCKNIYEMQRETLKNKYAEIRDETDSDEDIPEDGDSNG